MIFHHLVLEALSSIPEPILTTSLGSHPISVTTPNIARETTMSFCQHALGILVAPSFGIGRASLLLYFSGESSKALQTQGVRGCAQC